MVAFKEPFFTLAKVGRAIARHYWELGRHIVNWVEGYIWAPLSLLLVYGAGRLDYFLTGRKDMTNADWLVDYSSVFVKCILIILLASILKQAGSTSLTKEERLAHPFLSLVSDLFTMAAACLFASLFTR